MRKNSLWEVVDTSVIFEAGIENFDDHIPSVYISSLLIKCSLPISILSGLYLETKLLSKWIEKNRQSCCCVWRMMRNGKGRMLTYTIACSSNVWCEQCEVIQETIHFGTNESCSLSAIYYTISNGSSSHRVLHLLQYCPPYEMPETIFAVFLLPFCMQNINDVHNPLHLQNSAQTFVLASG